MPNPTGTKKQREELRRLDDEARKEISEGRFQDMVCRLADAALPALDGLDIAEEMAEMLREIGHTDKEADCKFCQWLRRWQAWERGKR